jgi:hypothetical protein
MKKLLLAIVIILTVSTFSFAQDHNNNRLPAPTTPKAQIQDFTEIQHVYKVDSLSFDNKRWQKIDPPKTIEITSDSVIVPEKVLHIASVLKSQLGDYVISFTDDPAIYVFDFTDDLILVGTKSGLGFILHIRRPKTLLPNIA